MKRTYQSLGPAKGKPASQRTFKTLGPKASHLVAELTERNRSIFSIRDVRTISRLKPGPARSFMAKLVGRGIATRLKPGLFVLVPFEFGHVRQFIGNPYAVAHELAGGRHYYLSHATAMDIRKMLTQPQHTIYVTTLRTIPRQQIAGIDFRFPRISKSRFFGTTSHWADPTHSVVTSDIERTVIDGLKDPDYCGGILEVAKGLWMRRDEVDLKRLVEYALRLDIGAVVRRLGFLLELWQLSAPIEIDRLRRRLTNTYVLLDPSLPSAGKFQRRWRLRLNLTPKELQAAVTT